MNDFLSNQQGFVSKKIMLLAAILIIAVFFFTIAKEKMECTHSGTDDRFGYMLNDEEPSTVQDCRVSANPDTGESTDPSTNPSDTPGSTGGSGSTGSSGSGGSGETSSGGSGGGSSTGGSGDNGTVTNPPSGFVPISYYDSSGVSLRCTDSQSYYAFTIPNIAPPQSVGTKTLTIRNNKGWDMWIKITNIEPKDGLSITSYDSLYKSLPNGDSTSFDIRWNWDVPSSYSGNKGGATVYFKTVCSAPSDSETYRPIPNSPSNFIVSNKTENAISLRWDASQHADKYKLYRSGAGLIYEGTSLSFVDQNLQPGTYYYYQLYAVNTKGTSNDSVTSTTTNGVSPLPTTPTNFKIAEKTDNSMKLTWNPVSNATTYYLQINGSWREVGNVTSYQINNLMAGTFYSYYLYAKNEYGQSSTTYTSGNTTGTALTPAQPLNFRVTNRTNTTLTLEWDPVPNATSYRLWNYVNVTVPSTQTRYVATGLTPGFGYHIYMRAMNEYGNSPSTSVLAYTTGEYPYPSVPSNFRISSKTDTKMTLSWNESTNATSYTLTRNGQVIYTGSNTSFEVTGLTRNTYYTYNVKANNSYGSSSWGTTSGYTENVTYDDSSDLGNQCQSNQFTKSFIVPNDAVPGSNGTFDIQIENSSSQNLIVTVENVHKSGGLFSGTYPITVEYDTNPKTLGPNSTLRIPINWRFPSEAGSEYDHATGSMNVAIKTSCP